jgi:hypothetical protein
VQDIIAILMMVLLSTVAVSQQFSGTELLVSVLKLMIFLTIWFISGIFSFIPTLLKGQTSVDRRDDVNYLIGFVFDDGNFSLQTLGFLRLWVHLS